MDSFGILRFDHDRNRHNSHLQYIGSGWSYLYSNQFRRVYFDTDINCYNKCPTFNTCSTNNRCSNSADLFNINRKCSFE